ncbi:hypothetical protein F5146DRAFT_1006949 [Armillaria mellea]|nr:hypothetical protein F5146DRAFT_1006949 [Armillaria mellea]
MVVETVGGDMVDKEDKGDDTDTKEASEGSREKALTWLKEKLKTGQGPVDVCIVQPGSVRGWTCNCCKMKKAACSLNKGESSMMLVGSMEVLDLLTKLVHKVDGLAEAVDEMKEEMAEFWGCINDLTCWTLTTRHGKPLASNSMICLGTIKELKKRRDHFQKTHAEFYALGGWHKEWMFWKEYLRVSKCEEFLVEDSDLEEEVHGGEIREEMGPLGGRVGIAALDRVVVEADRENGEVEAAGPSTI